MQWTRGERRASAVAGALAVLLLLAVGEMAVLARDRRRAEVALVEAIVAEADALGVAGRWDQARERYQRARDRFAALGLASTASELGLLDVHHHAPLPLLTLAGHTGAVRAVRFLPDGHRAVSASDDGSVRLWDVALGREIRRLPADSRGVSGLAASADGRVVLAGGQDGSVRLFDLESGRRLRTLAARGGPVLKVALSPDARLALSRTAEGVVQLWDLGTGGERRSFNVLYNRLVDLAFSPDGRLAITGSELRPGLISRSRAMVWDVETGRVAQTLGPFGAEVESIGFSPDGRRVLTAAFDQTAALWDLASGERLFIAKGHLHFVKGAAFSPGDRLIVTGSLDRTIKLWDAETGKLVRSLDAGHGVLGLAVAPDGRFLLSAGDDRTIKLWDLSAGQEARTFSGHEGTVHSVALSPDARLAVSGGADQRLRLWDVATGREIRSLDGHHTVLHAVAFSPDGRMLASGGGDSNVAGGGDMSIVLWDLRQGSKLRVLAGHTGVVRRVTFSPDGKLLLSGSQNGEVKLWAVTGQLLRSWQHGSDVRDVTFSPDGRLVFAGSREGIARLWDVEAGRERRSLVTAPPERITAVAISPDGRWALTGSMAQTIRLWEVATGKEIRSLDGHLSDVRAVRFSPDGRTVFSASRDRTMRIWDRATGRPLHTFTWTAEPTWSFALSGDGRLALAGNQDGKMTLWDLSYVGRYRRLETAVVAALSVLRDRPDDAPSLATLGEWYAFRGVAGWAIELLRRAEQAGARVSALTLGRCYWQEADLEGARRALRGAGAAHEAPADYLQLLVDQMGRSDQAGPLTQLSLKDGRVRYPFLGIRAGRATAGGALVTYVFGDGPADLAGLHAGDAIVRVDEQTIDDDGGLGRTLATRTAGSTITLTYVHDGELAKVDVTLGERPSHLVEVDGKPLRERKSGLALHTVTTEVAVSLGLDPTTRGAVVTEIGADPPPEIARRIATEDVLVKVGDRTVRTAEEAAAAIAALPADRWDALAVIRPPSVR